MHTCTQKMADSDDDSDKKKRDKFRRERSDYTDRPRRSDHGDRRGWREDYYDQRRRSRDEYDDDRERRRFSPPGRREWGSPPSKRSRREGWESLRDYGGMGMVPPPFGIMERRGGWMMHDMPPGAPMPPGARSLPNDMMMGYGSPMGDPHHRRVTLLTFKQFLVQQDDNINDQEAFRMYQEYKTDFKKKQAQQFFNDHKEEDWFLAKYHPKHLELNKKEERKSLYSRVQVFVKLLNNGTLDETPLTVSSTNAITRVMDTAVILMEGGTDRDLLSLDQSSDQEEVEVEEVKQLESAGKKEDSVPREEQSVSSHDKDSNESSPPKPSFMMTEPTPEQQRLVQLAKDYQRQRMESTGEVIAPNGESERGHEKSRKRKRDEYSFDDAEGDVSSSEDGAQEDDSEAEEPPPPGMEEPPPPGTDDVEMSEQQDQAGQEEEEPKMEQEEEEPKMEQEEDKPAKPNPLHFTKAVYIRHIPPSISSSDILEVCQAFPGYLRMAFGDPLPDKGYERRGWVTFSNETNIKDVCAKLNSEKIKNIQLSCQVNRDLTRRVKSISGVTWSRKVILNDLEQLKKVTHALDKQQRLWNYAEKDGTEDDELAVGILEMETDDAKCNPVINFSEQQLLAGEQQDEKPVEDDEDDEEGAIRDPGTELVSTSSPILQVLDRLIWYLRLVHSVDYYNGTVFPDEDHMPHRCGIITARLPRPGSVNLEDITEHIRSMESKLQPLLVSKGTLSEEDVEKLGKRDHDTEVEKFVEVNTVKQSENKYLCPLSGKKFKGIEFVRKHIFNKHSAKVEEVKDETDFFNNYLRDPDRPIPLDGSGIIAAIGGGGRPPRPGGEDGPGRMGGPADWGKDSGRGFASDAMGGFGRGGFPGRRPLRGGMRGGRGGPRRQIQRYNDLDAPEDPY